MSVDEALTEYLIEKGLEMRKKGFIFFRSALKIALEDERAPYHMKGSVYFRLSHENDINWKTIERDIRYLLKDKNACNCEYLIRCEYEIRKNYNLFYETTTGSNTEVLVDMTKKKNVSRETFI